MILKSVRGQLLPHSLHVDALRKRDRAVESVEVKERQVGEEAIAKVARELRQGLDGKLVQSADDLNQTKVL